MRINKFLAKAGLGSRRSVEQLVLAGKIKVNDKVITKLSTKVDAKRDTVTYNGKILSIPEKEVYIMLNKPPGYIVTADDPFNRKTVFELLPEFSLRIFPVGRLDKNSRGLLFFTNNGKWANRIIHPGQKITKIYHVQVKGKMSHAAIKQLRSGIKLDDFITQPTRVFFRGYKKSQDLTKLKFYLSEGKKRQIRRMIKHVGSSVVDLRRVRIGKIKLGNLPEGYWRYLTEKEINKF